jgi:aryl-alcohol dehydrogenase-like predicted oxidoreductase
MDYSATAGIPLGNTTITVSPLGIGTWAWGDSLFWSYGKDYTETDLHAAFNAAIAAGVTLFDTAEIYGLGESERLIGKFMQTANQPVQIATKYFPLPWRITAKSVSEALTASLQRLQLESVPLYQIHWPFDFLMGQRTLMAALAEEVKQRRIGAIGVSNYSAGQMQRAYDMLASHGVPLAVNQVRYSLLDRHIETNGVLKTAQQLGITILAYSPLAQGLLTGKYTPDRTTTATGARRIDSRFSPTALAKISPLLTVLEDIGNAHQRTPAQVALNWLMAQGVIPIPGAKNAKQAHQNAGALGWHLSPQELNWLSTALPRA